METKDIKFTLSFIGSLQAEHDILQARATKYAAKIATLNGIMGIEFSARGETAVWNELRAQVSKYQAKLAAAEEAVEIWMDTPYKGALMGELFALVGPIKYGEGY